MSRSHYAHRRPVSALCAAAAASSMLWLAPGCRFSTNPNEEVFVVDSGAPSAAMTSTSTSTSGAAPQQSGVAGEDAFAQRNSSGAISPTEPDAAVVDDAGERDSAAASSNASASSASAPSVAVAMGIAASMTDAAIAASMTDAAIAASMTDADADVVNPPNTQAGPDAEASSDRARMAEQCSADLATCLVANPLDYAECLRINADNNCPEPDAGATTTTPPVTGEDGEPLSQACQAELAACIMRMPTPENADACLEKARTCKL